MREVNFSIPNANKASVGITTALYDRRALDCTSTLPLINSLNNLAYLTTSSARIRDILTVDGGIERLVCILKEGRCAKDMMECWKWNLAFQCVVNIGVRGSEGVRTRVVEADMVPVIATILENYIRVIDKCREKADAEIKRSARQLGSSAKHYSRTSDLLLPGHHGMERIRRQAPTPIEIPSPQSHAPNVDPTSTIPTLSLSSPPERTTFRSHHHHRSHESRTPMFPSGSSRSSITQPLVTAVPTLDMRQDTFGIRPVRDADRLPSMLSTSHLDLNPSQPVSPTTPSAPVQPPSQLPTVPNGTGRARRPSIRHHISVSGSSDDIPSDDGPAGDSMANASATTEPVVTIENDIQMQDIVDAEGMMDDGGSPVRLEPPPAEPADVDTFNLARSALEGSIGNPTTNQNAANFGLTPLQNFNAGLGAMNPTPSQMPLNPYTRFVQERSASAGVLSSMPRDEDVLMCLQLLAYVSKYCNLRSYFQKTHTVPKLKISNSELAVLEGEAAANKVVPDEEEIEEYLQPDDFNIFPLVEKFTVRHHTPDMQYWAGVVMRNLCRKDDARGGIRQCAYYQCGKWEEFTRQFAKCRRCRRTKYCSKECQKNAWVYHRHWCVPAQDAQGR